MMEQLHAGRLQYVGGKMVNTSYDCYIAMDLAEDGDLFAFR